MALNSIHTGIASLLLYRYKGINLHAPLHLNTIYTKQLLQELVVT
jgi:hypothetical protein